MNKNLKSKLVLASAGAILGVSLLSTTVGFAAGKSNNIGIEKAKSIALQDAGLQASNVQFVKAKLDTDDGVRVYDIEFYSGNTEYDYEIHARTGRILEKDLDIENFSIKKPNKPNKNQQQNGLIGVEKAKSIALNAAGVNSANARFKKAKLDTDDGIQVYEIEFKVGRTEYDFDINARTGAIVKSDVDYDD